MLSQRCSAPANVSVGQTALRVGGGCAVRERRQCASIESTPKRRLRKRVSRTISRVVNRSVVNRSHDVSVSVYSSVLRKSKSKSKCSLCVAGVWWVSRCCCCCCRRDGRGLRFQLGVPGRSFSLCLVTSRLQEWPRTRWDTPLAP